MMLFYQPLNQLHILQHIEDNSNQYIQLTDKNNLNQSIKQTNNSTHRERKRKRIEYFLSLNITHLSQTDNNIYYIHIPPFYLYL